MVGVVLRRPLQVTEAGIRFGLKRFLDPIPQFHGILMDLGSLGGAI